MKQNVFFFGIAYALSIGSVLLLGGRRDAFSKVDPRANLATTEQKADLNQKPASSVASAPAATNHAFETDRNPDFPSLARSRFAMTQKLQSLDVFNDSANSPIDDLPPAISLGKPLPQTRVDAVNTIVAQADPFELDEIIKSIESPVSPVPTPVESSDDELDLITPAATDVEDPAKLAALRETIATLTKTKAELLNVKAMEMEITQLQKQIANLQAARRLLDAHQVLEKLIQEFPESPAAFRAKAMLRVLPTPKGPRDQRAPTPDENFLNSRQGA